MSGPRRARCLSLLLAVVVRATADPDSPLQPGNCSPPDAAIDGQHGYGRTESIDIALSRHTPLSVVDIWLNIPVRIVSYLPAALFCVTVFIFVFLFSPNGVTSEPINLFSTLLPLHYVVVLAGIRAPKG